MARYIDADALMKELEREVELADDWKTAHEIVNVVKYFPTIEPERKNGYWICHDAKEGFLIKKYTCSICNYYSGTQKPNFCPNCGAGMEKEE